MKGEMEVEILSQSVLDRQAQKRASEREARIIGDSQAEHLAVFAPNEARNLSTGANMCGEE